MALWFCFASPGVGIQMVIIWKTLKTHQKKCRVCPSFSSCGSSLPLGIRSGPKYLKFDRNCY